MEITITEALAEVPTLVKRIDKKQRFVTDFLARPANARDPHEKDGGSGPLLAQTLQSIKDLEERLIDIRSGIARANATHQITIGDKMRTITDWLTWRREIAEGQRSRLNSMAGTLRAVHQQAQSQGGKTTDNQSGTAAPTDWIVNINEKDLSDQIEALETILGTLDGQLSLKNATITITLP
jgi:hypothetical protein